MIDYSFKYGETVLVSLDMEESDNFLNYTNMSCNMQRMRGEVVSLTEPAFAMTVTQREATDSLPAGWDFTVPDEINLYPGVYMIDAHYQINGHTDITDRSLIVRLEKVASSS